MKFAFVSSSEWELGPIDAERRARLLGTRFEEVVETIAREAAVVSCDLKALNEHPGARRASVRLRVCSRVVDIFHSGAGGYRAQFYLGAANGEDANRYCLDELAALIFRARAWNCPDKCIESSIRHFDTKIWIHEGAWLSDNKPANWNLSVKAWEKNAPLVGLQHRFEPSWARLMPSDEVILEVKGGCIDENCQPLDIELKPKRSEEIHLHGYT